MAFAERSHYIFSKRREELNQGGSRAESARTPLVLPRTFVFRNPHPSLPAQFSHTFDISVSLIVLSFFFSVSFHPTFTTYSLYSFRARAPNCLLPWDSLSNLITATFNWICDCDSNGLSLPSPFTIVIYCQFKAYLRKERQLIGHHYGAPHVLFLHDRLRRRRLVVSDQFPKVLILVACSRHSHSIDICVIDAILKLIFQ